MIGAFDHILRRIIVRALLALLIAAFTIVAICYFTAAATMALDAHYGALYARLIMGAIGGAVALAGVIWWAALSRRSSANARAVDAHRETQVAMLVKAVMLGYSLARKGSRAT